MSPIGGGKPLFDLIPGGRRVETSAPSTPTDGEPPVRAGDDRAGQHHAALSGILQIPVVWLYIVGAVALVALILLYGVGYRLGVSAERERWREQASREAQSVFVDDPLAVRDAEPGSDGGAPAPAATESADRAVVTASGVVAKDPRIVGNNYLELASLPREKAEEAVRYLDAQGIKAIAVPRHGVDRRRDRPNTSDPYRVVSLDLAVPSDRYSALRREREALERRVKRAGKAWAEAGGASDFSDPLWRRFGG